MNKTLLSLLTLGLSMGVLSSNAQAPNMRAVNAIVSQNHMNMQMQMQRMMFMNMNMARGSKGLSNYKSTYQVVLKDSTVKEVRSKILFDERHVSYLLAEDKSLEKDNPARVQRIYPADTRSIHKVNINGNLSPAGLPADSCWLFQMVKGKVNGYSYLPPVSPLHSGYLKFVQNGTGELQKLDTEVLKTLISDNHKAVRLVNDQKFYEAMVEYNKVKPVKK